MWNRLLDLGQPGEEILAAWIANEEQLRTLLALARTNASRHQISHRGFLPVVRRHRAVPPRSDHPGMVGADRGIHLHRRRRRGRQRLIELEARNAFGFRNTVNQRLRSRCASVRAAC